MRPGEVTVILGGSALLVGSWVVAAAEHSVPPAEARAFSVVNDLPDGPWPLVWLPMQLGSYVSSLAVPAGVLAITRQPRLAGAALAASQVAFWSSKLVKRSVQRGRPAALLDHVVQRERASGLGYVSGHAAVAFSMAAAIAPSVPRPWRPALFGGAAFVGLARQYAGVHLPLDVVGGTGLGILAGTVARWAWGLGGAGVDPADHTFSRSGSRRGRAS